jgi:hypothetical protein
VHDVERRPADRCRADDLGHGLDARARLDAAAVANMDEYRRSEGRREPENLNHLVPCRARRVLEAHAHTQGSHFNLPSKGCQDPIETLARGRLIGGWAGLRNDSRRWPHDADGQRPIPREDTRCQVRGAGTEVDGGVAATRLDEALNIGNADFELQRGGNPVQRQEAIRILALPMLMKIDEAWGDDQAAHVDRPSTSQRFSGNPYDRTTANPEVADPVQVGLRIDDSAGLQHDLERFRSARAGAQPD